MKRKVFKLMAAALIVSTTFVACDKDDDDNGGGQQNTTDAIKVTNEQSLTQEVYANNVAGKSLTSFTTTGPWTSSIAETTPSTNSVQLRNASAWISIDPASGDTAGTYNVSIILEPNATGKDRTAVITILCKGEEIKITITQKGVTEENKPLEIKDLLVAHPWKIYSMTSPDGIEYFDEIVLFTFYADGTLNADGDDNRYTISGNTLTINGEIYTINNITNSELVITGPGFEVPDCRIGEDCEDPIPITITIKFVKP